MKVSINCNQNLEIHTLVYVGTKLQLFKETHHNNDAETCMRLFVCVWDEEEEYQNKDENNERRGGGGGR